MQWTCDMVHDANRKAAGYWHVHCMMADESIKLAHPGEEEGSSLSALHAALAFIGALSDEAADGRISFDSKEGTLKFVLLNPAAHFSQVPHQSCQPFLVMGSWHMQMLPSAIASATASAKDAF